MILLSDLKDPFHILEKDIPDFEKPDVKKSLLERLFELYMIEMNEEHRDGEATKESYLLSKIVKEDHLSVLIVNLYPGNEGYSLMLKKKDGSHVETVRLPYEENEFLEFLDMQQLPPLLVDVLESAQVDLYHDGCVIVELRDYRRNTQKSFDASYILLKPTCQTVVRDVNAMMSDSSKWTDDDKAMLEAQLVLAMQPRLCLDPSPDVLYAANKIQYHANKWNHKGLKRSMKRFSQPYLNRAVLCSNTASPPCLRLFDFIQRNRDKRLMSSYHKLNRASQHTDMWKQRTPTLSVPSKIDVQLYARMHDQPKFTTDYTPEKIQEIILEGEKTNNRSYFCRVTIQKRSSTGEYIGDLYLEEDPDATKEHKCKDGRPCKDGRSCRFSLGNRLTAQRYLQQFQELYTEEGRKSVKISTFVASQKSQSTGQGTQSTNVSQAQHQHSNLKSSTTHASTSQPSETTLSVNLTRSLGQNSVFSQQGNTYILASSVQGQPFNIASNVVMSIPNSLAQSLVSGNATFSVSGNPYFVNASGTIQQALASKNLQSSIKQAVSGSSISSTHAQLTAVPIAVQGNNVSIVPGNMNAQFITKPTAQAIRPTAGATGQIMVQNVASTPLGQRLQASFAVPGNLVPISNMTRVGTQQKGQLGTAGMASVMVHGKQVMVQGSPMIQGQATFIPSQTPLIPGLQGGQAAIIQGGSIFVQGQPGQGQGQTVMIQGQPGQPQAGQGALLQGQALQGQTLFIQGQSNHSGSQTIMLQNQNQRGQVQLITTTTSSAGQQLQIVPQIQQKQGTSTSVNSRGQASTALSALTSQVNLIPVQQGSQQSYQPIVQFTTQGQQPRPITQRRRSSSQQNIMIGGKKRQMTPNKPSPS